MEGLLDINQAARFIGLKKGTLYNMVSRKLVPYHKVGGRDFFIEAELQAWFESTLVPCERMSKPPGKRAPRRKVDVEAIVKDAVEEYTRG